MYGDASLAAGARANSPVYTGALFLLFALALLLRASLPPPFLDTFINYTPDYGSIVEKIHPGTYALAGVFALTLLTVRARIDAWSYRTGAGLLGLGAAIALLIVYLAMAGRTSAAGYLIDTYVAAMFAGLTLLLFPPAVRARAGELMLALILVSSALGIVEYLTRTRIMPYPTGEPIFRPTGLAGHPLTLGLLGATAILFVSMARWSPAIRLAAIGLLFIGVAAASARIALLAAAVAVFFAILGGTGRGGSSAQRARLRSLLLVGGTIGLVGAITVLAMSGFLDRFIARGLLDTSAMARVDVYRLFALTEWRDILLGTDIVTISKIAEQQLGLLAIESSPVILVYQFGVFGALLFAAALLMAIARALSGAPIAAYIAVMLFFAVALSNNTLTTKTPVVLILFVLLIGLQAQRASRPRAGA